MRLREKDFSNILNFQYLIERDIKMKFSERIKCVGLLVLLRTRRVGYWLDNRVPFPARTEITLCFSVYRETVRHMASYAIATGKGR
jgi:hypothetical protein